MIVASGPIDGVAWSQIRDYARRVAMFPVNADQEGVSDYRMVGEYAGKFALSYYQNVDALAHDVGPDIQRAMATGWLIYTISHHGLAYEDLLSQVGRTVTEDVASVTADNRRPRQQRWELLVGSAAHASIPARWALVAEITARCEELIALAEQDALPAEIHHWLPCWLVSRKKILGGLSDWAKQPGLRVAQSRITTLEDLTRPAPVGRRVPHLV